MAIQPDKAHFFIQGNSFTQSAAQSFGPDGTDNFRLTSRFSLTQETMAFAICKGIALIVPSEASGKVNLVLRPFRQPVPGLNIKYFVYRGLKLADFFSGTDVIGTGSDFINKVNLDFSSFFAGNTIPVFKAQFLGYDTTIPTTTKLSDLFFKKSEQPDSTTETHAFELPMIDIGKSLGHFTTGECGIDVVLHYGDYENDFDNGDFVFDYAYAKKQFATITLSGTDWQKKLQREQSTQFIDLAAFYGLFAADGKVISDNAGTKSDHTGTSIYTNLMTAFATKNRWYFYIQGDRGRSYDFYGFYHLSATNTNNFKFGFTETSLAESVYGTNGWPLWYTEQGPAASGTKNNLFLQLVTDNNVNLAVYSRAGKFENAQQNGFCNADDLRLPPDTAGTYGRLTKILHFSNPATATGGTSSNIAGISMLLYQGVAYPFQSGTQTDENNVVTPVYSYGNFFDDIFDLVKAKPLLANDENAAFAKMTSERPVIINYYFDKKQQGVMVAQTVTISDVVETGDDDLPTLERVTYITESTDIISNPISTTPSITADTKTTTSASGSVGVKLTYDLPSPFFYKIRPFNDSSAKIVGIELKTTDNSKPSKIVLGLTKTENDKLKALIPDIGGLTNPRLVLLDLFTDDNQLLSYPENVPYQKYKIGILGESITDGKLQFLMPTETIYVYSLDRNYHFTKAYSDRISDPELDKDYFIINTVV